MSQISQYLRKAKGSIAHFCPGCCGMHYIRIEPPYEPKQCWIWDGNIVLPTISPSIHITCPDPDGEFPPEVCHYYLKAGRIQFLPDCTHALKGITMDMPPLPDYARDNRLP